ncbi:MAG: DUF2600 family protein, partial [Mycobacteriales bacterium]
ARQRLERWAGTQIPALMEMEWWEIVAAGGSSLSVYALIAAAADQALEPGAPCAIESAYFPWIGALHSLLDSFVDVAEDAEIGQLSLIGCYTCREDAATRMGAIATRAVSRARVLPRGERHAVILAAMAGYYLSGAETLAAEAGPISTNVSEAIGGLARPIRLVFRARELASRAER